MDTLLILQGAAFSSAPSVVPRLLYRGQRAAEAAEPDLSRRLSCVLQLIRFCEAQKETSGEKRKKSPHIITGTPRSFGGSLDDVRGPV